MIVAERYHLDVVYTHWVSPLFCGVINDDALVLSPRPLKDNILSMKVTGIEYAYGRLLRTQGVGKTNAQRMRTVHVGPCSLKTIRVWQGSIFDRLYVEFPNQSL
jgi:hypothetical protein